MKKPYLDYQCIRCLITRNLKIDEADATDEDKTSYVRELLKIITEAPTSSSAPDVVEKINKLQKDFNIFTFDCKKIKSLHAGGAHLEGPAGVCRPHFSGTAVSAAV